MPFHSLNIFYGVFWPHKISNLCDSLIKSNMLEWHDLPWLLDQNYLISHFFFVLTPVIYFLGSWPAKWKMCVLLMVLMPALPLTCRAFSVFVMRLPSVCNVDLILTHVSTRIWRNMYLHILSIRLSQIYCLFLHIV